MAGFYGEFAKAADRFGDRVAVEVQRRDGLESWTYAQLRGEAERLSELAAAKGIGRGDRCALLSENDAMWCAAYLGLLRAGAVPVPLDTSYTPQQVEKLIGDSGARLTFVSPQFRETPPGEVVVLERSATPGAAPPLATPPADVGPDEMAVIMYTSGTTSDPKGVVLTHGNLVGECHGALQCVTLDDTDSILGVLPLFHALAQFANLLLPFSVGARVVFLETIGPSELVQALHDREITTFCCVPQFFYLIHQRIRERIDTSGVVGRALFAVLLFVTGTLRERTGINLGRRIFARAHAALGPRMRMLVTGGSRFDPKIGRDLYRMGFNILQAYGLTETSGGAAVTRPGDRHIESVGHPIPGVEVKIIKSDVAAELDDERIGEVTLRGPVVSPGYYKRPDVNAVTFRDGWLHTGDLGYQDSSGRLYITGRAKEVIVLGSGKNIYPEEIESLYAASPYIKELCVMGRADPDEPSSERLHAVVVPDFQELRARKIFNSRDWLRYAIENISGDLPGHKRIMSYEIVTDDLPRTTTRKLKRFAIEKRVIATAHESRPEQPAPDEPWPSDRQTEAILEILRANLKHPERLLPSAHLELDMGLDSMGRVELLAQLEARLGAVLSEEVVHSIHTAGELVDAVRAGADAPGASERRETDPWSALLDDASADGPAAGPVPAGRLWSFATYLVSKAVYAVSWLLLGLRVSGRENLPREGAYLISPNHQSYLDAFLLASTFPFRVSRGAFYVGATEYFSSPLGAWLAKILHVVPVDADANLVRAMRAGARGLRDGGILILFPEGERSIDGTLKAFKKGAAILSMKTQVPIVPVALDGFFDLWPRGGGFRLRALLPFVGPRPRVHYGAPLHPETGAEHSEELYDSATGKLRSAVASLLDS